MNTPRRPQLRPLLDLASARTQDGDEVVVFVDLEGLATRQVAVAPQLALLLRVLLDGTRDVETIRRDWLEAAGTAPSAEQLEGMIRQLDEAVLLEGPTADAARGRLLQAFRASPRRPCLFCGKSYPASADELKKAMAAWREASGVDPVSGPVRAVLAPHIDPRGGAACHGAAIAALAASPAEVFVVLGTAHDPLRHPYALTTQAFETPFGEVPVDAELVRRLAAPSEGRWLEEEHRHATEHSVEFQVSWLKGLHAARPGLRIVPLLAGSQHECMAQGRAPDDDPAVAGFVATLRTLRQEYADALAVVASVDFAHVGPAYGDAEAPGAEGMERVLLEDRRLLERVLAVDPQGFFERLAKDGNPNHVCGGAPTWTLLASLAGEDLTPELLRHDAWEIDPGTGSHVSFAAVAFRAAQAGTRRDG